MNEESKGNEAAVQEHRESEPLFVDVTVRVAAEEVAAEVVVRGIVVACTRETHQSVHTQRSKQDDGTAGEVGAIAAGRPAACTENTQADQQQRRKAR